MNKKTIILLSAKRGGTTAIFKMFQKHPDVGVCHIDQNIHLWEGNFWNLAAKAIDGDPQPFLNRFVLKEKSHPFLKIPDKFTEESAFELWDSILEKLGPVVFDKSPQYLGDQRAFDLLKKYMDTGADVRLFAFIRDPKDTITSQYELWNKHVENDSPKRRGKLWMEKYSHLERLQDSFGYIPLFRYEDFCRTPAVYAPILFKHCGVENISETYEHIKPINVGRYFRSLNKDIRNWEFSEEFKDFIKKYGYSANEHKDEKVKFTEYLKFFYKKVKNRISPYKVN